MEWASSAGTTGAEFCDICQSYDCILEFSGALILGTLLPLKLLSGFELLPSVG